MGAAESGQEVIESLLVCKVEDAESKPQFRSVRLKQIVDTDAEIEQMAWRNPRRVVDIIGRAFGRNPDARRPIVRRGAVGRSERCPDRRRLAATEESDRRLLVRRQG